MIYASLDEVVAEAVSILGADGGESEIAKNFCRTWIWTGLKRLGYSQDDKLVVKIDAKNLLVKKPKNMRKFDEIALYDSADNYIPHTWNKGVKRIYPDTESSTYTENAGTDAEIVYHLPVDLSESKDSFVIGTNGSFVAYAKVRFFGFPLDDTGLPLIRDIETEALTLYCRYKWSQRKNLNQSEIRENKIAWFEVKDWTIAAKKVAESSNEDKKQMAATRNRMLPNFNRSRF